jgi:Phosphotransferase enzyme family
MLNPPDGLPQDALVSALASEWGIAVAAMSYRAVGFGSHHWEVTDVTGTRWFVNADELEIKRHRPDEPLSVPAGRLRASLAAARDLRDRGLTFVVAPVPGRGGELLAQVSDRFGVALYPFVDGESFGWGEFSTAAHRRGVLDMIIAVHTAADASRSPAVADDFSIPYRDELEAALSSPASAADSDCGPYGRPAALLLAGNAAAVRGLLGRYDELARLSHARSGGAVLTHGEPHPGNTMRTPGGWLLIDWDTVLVAPPERDLWSLDPGDGSILDAYATATGVTPQPAMLELYRVRWDLADIAASASQFRRPHTGTANDDESWQILRDLIAQLADAR